MTLSSLRITASFVAASLATLALQQPAQAEDAAAGATVYARCQACHTTGTSQGNGVGPNLNGIVGRKAATRPGYLYSPAMRRSGLVWTKASLDRFLTRPGAIVPGNKMGFAGIADPIERANLIAYLATLKIGG